MKLIIFLLISFNAYGMRVVSTSPALSEMVARLGHEKDLVGVTPYCLDGKNAVKIGTALELDYEKVMSLKPDIVLLQENTPGKVHEGLNKLKIPVLALKIVGLDDLFESWQQIAKFLKNDGKEIIKLKKLLQESSFKGNAVFVLGGVPAQSVMVAGKKTFYDDLMGELGLKNQVEQKGWPVLDAETLQSLSLKDLTIFEFATSSERLWKKEQWLKFCPECQVIAWSDPRATFPGPSMVESLIRLLEKSK